MNHINTLFQNGMQWLRADFHLHTMRDKEFIYDDDHNDFIKQYIARLKKEDIHIGIIANHNKFDREEYRNLRDVARKEGIWIVPGIELSVNDGANGIHCIIVFDCKSWLAKDDDYINQFLVAAFEGIANWENENTRCNYNFEKLLERLDVNRKSGRDSFVILAHAQHESGFFYELKGGRIEQLSRTVLFKKSVLALQKMRTYDKIDVYKNWFGGTLPAFVEGSDCKSIDGVGKAPEQSGKKMETYVKIGDYNFEALKYALLDYDNRIRTESPSIHNSCIKSVHFEGGKLGGQTIDFSPELNSLIGIRGSGKSAIIEIIRDTLGISFSNSSADKDYKEDLVSYILGSGGKVILTVIDNYGKEYQIEKINGQTENIYNADDLIQDCSIEAIFNTPVYFGQKDLSNKDVTFEADLVNRLIGTRLKDIWSQIDSKKRDIKSLILEIKKSQDLKTLKEETSNTIKDAKQKIAYYTEQGVEEKLKLQTQFDSDLMTLNQNRETLQNYLDDLKTIIHDYKIFFSKKMEGSEANKEIIEKGNETLQKAKLEFDKLQSICDNTTETLAEYDSVISELKLKADGMQDEFAQIKRELNSDTLNPDTFLSLNRVINTSNLKLQEIENLEKTQTELQKKLLGELSILNELWRSEYKILEDETKKINGANSALQIEVEFKGQKGMFVEKLRNVFKGTGIRETAFQNIADEYKDFIEVYRDRDKLKNIVNENQIGSFNRRFEEYLADLLTFKVENRVMIKYKGKSLDKHSLGQRASALILFLLAQNDTDVLIIDQPEDDLDNQTIYDEVIKELVKLKGKMQFIFATHNANIPVLGDSEKVIACDFDDPAGITVESGTIDTPDIQKAVVNIMEGGEEAFSKRKNIYNLWETKN